MQTIPRNVSIFSIDRYLGQGTPYPHLSEANTTRAFLSEYVVGRMNSSTQRLLLIPGLFGDRDFEAAGTLAEQSLGLRKKLWDYWRWLSVDPSVAPAAGVMDQQHTLPFVAGGLSSGASRSNGVVAVAGMAVWHWMDFPTVAFTHIACIRPCRPFSHSVNVTGLV